jgi:hypothetical protein
MFPVTNMYRDVRVQHQQALQPGAMGIFERLSLLNPVWRRADFA